MEALRGYPVLLAETFVDPTLFAGTCCRAAGWQEIGETRGFGRDAGGWRKHGCPKKVLLRPLRPGAAKALGGLDEPASWGCGSAGPPKADRLRSLYEFLREVPEFRKPRGVRHQLSTVLAIALAGKLAGVRAFCSPRSGRPEPPSASLFHRILSSLDPEALDRALRRWPWTARRPRNGCGGRTWSGC